jgi:hypothetical protein
MTCNTCNIHKGEFKTENDYSIFENKIKLLEKQQILKLIKQVDVNNPFLIYEYKCTQCGQNWEFSIPDQAFRGGWNVRLPK